MAIPTPQMMDTMVHGLEISILTDKIHHVPLTDFFKLPEPGERNPWPRTFWLGRDWFDDGGGAAIAGYQFGRCPFVASKEPS